ncbi:MAG: tRNA lysidine(34) synthetase TilS [Sphingobium sp.]
MAALIGEPPAGHAGAGTGAEARFAVAVSGGPDSMALLWLAVRAFPGQVQAATVDHGLRAEARAEAEMVARWCRDEGVPHAILLPDRPIGGSVQAAARAARYALLHRWRETQGLGWLLTAHHADDQRETVLMRLNRSSGVGGLAAIRARNGAVLRPLLGWRRAELAAIVAARGLPCVDDPSNRDERFDRVTMRNHLAGVEWIDPLAVSRSAAACADAEEALCWMVAQLAREHVESDGQGGFALRRWDFPMEMQRRLVSHMLAMAEPGAVAPRGNTLDQALARMRAGEKASIGNWLLSGGPIWTVRPAPPRRR